MNKEQLQSKLDDAKGIMIIVLIIALLAVTIVSCNYPTHNKMPKDIVIPYISINVDGHEYISFNDYKISHKDDCDKCKEKN